MVDISIGARSVARRYNINFQRVQHWIDKLKGINGEAAKVFHETKGRPFSIDDDGLNETSNTLRSNRTLKKCLLNA